MGKIRSTVAELILIAGVISTSLLASDVPAASATEQAPSRLLRDINTDSIDSYPYESIEIDGVIFFAAEDGEYGRELWKSDGTEQGTTIVKDIRPGREGS